MSDTAGFLIGITGNSGCGQTTAAEYLNDECAGICSLDMVGHRLLDRHYVISELADAFSRPEFNHMAGKTIRTELRAIVHNDPEAYAVLNAVLHPRMIGWAAQCAQALRKMKGVWILEGALICELGINDLVDFLIVVQDSELRSISRVAARDNISYEDAAERWKVQLPIEYKSRLADAVVINSGEPDYMGQQILTIFQRIRKNLMNCSESE